MSAGSLIISCHMLDSFSDNDVESATSLAPLADMVNIMKASCRTLFYLTKATGIGELVYRQQCRFLWSLMVEKEITKL